MNERTADGEPLEDAGIAGTAEDPEKRERPEAQSEDRDDPNAAK